MNISQRTIDRTEHLRERDGTRVARQRETPGRPALGPNQLGPFQITRNIEQVFKLDPLARRDRLGLDRATVDLCKFARGELGHEPNRVVNSL